MLKKSCLFTHNATAISHRSPNTILFVGSYQQAQLLQPIIRRMAIVISGLFYHITHSKVDGATTVLCYIQYIVISGLDCTCIDNKHTESIQEVVHN